MKPWKPLLALTCLAFTVAPALAAQSPVRFQGLYYSPEGPCTVDALTDGLLIVRALGSSSDFGATVDCPHMDGMRLALAGDCDDTDNGAHVSLSFQWTVVGQPSPARVTSMTWSVASGHALCMPECSSLCSSPSQTVTLTRDGVVVYSCVVASGTPVSVAMDATGQCPNPTLSCSVLRPADGTVRWHGAAAFSRTVHVTVSAHDEDCDGLVVSSTVDPADYNCDGASGELRVSSPAGSHFDQVRCPDGQCRALDHFVSGTGASELSVLSSSSVSGKKLYVGNLPFSVDGGMEVVRASEDCDDVGDLTSPVSSRSTAEVALGFSPPSLSLKSPADAGASIALTIRGRMFSATGEPGPVGEVSSKISRAGDTMSGLLVTCDHSSLGADLETVDVMDGSTKVERLTILPNVAVTVLSTPGGPPLSPVVAFGRHHELSGHVTLIKGPNMVAGGGPTTASEETRNQLQMAFEVGFASRRVFVIGGQSFTGDELVFSGASSSPGSYTGSFDVTVTTLSVQNPGAGGSLTSLGLSSLSSVGHDEIFADVSSSSSISSAHPCVTVPFVFARTDSTPVRGYSVRFHLSPELAQCGASVVEGDYLSSVAGTQMFVTPNSDGSYSVDCSILGPVCGATGNGRLFSVDLTAVQPPLGSMGTITVDAVRVRDCSNALVPANPGASSTIPIQFGAPPAITSLVAVQDKLGNPPGGTTEITVSWPALTTVGGSVAVYKKGYGNYPEYDNGSSPGAVPSPPASSSAALSSGWSLVTCGSSCGTGACTSTCTATSVVDSPPTRDYLYYVAFTRDLYGNESPVSNMTPGTLDYHLGDVSDGASLCTGDNHVSLVDISFLGAHYGQFTPPGTPFTCLDVGPTLDFSVDTRPTTDGRIEFEDFMMFAINYSVVSAPAMAARPAPAPLNASQLALPPLPPPGGTFDAGVLVDGAGDVQGLSVRLAYDAAVLEPVGVAPGALMDQQGRPGAVLSSAPGTIDAALLGTGPGFAGHGELARVTFRVKAGGDPHLAIASITARDAANHPVAINGSAGGTAVPARTALGFAFPNPFREAVTIQLSLHRAGPAAIGIYDVAGRRVRMLVRGPQPAGARLITWDGRDDAGMRLAPGAYIVRLETAELRESRTVRLVR